MTRATKAKTTNTTTDPATKKLLAMLTYKRPAYSTTENNFTRRFLTSLGTQKDIYRNHWLTIPGNPHILFSSHTDTVHKSPGMQEITHANDQVSVKTPSNCLGADCGVGVWLMTEMIRAKVPGTYVFHAGEEIGGLGSKAVAEKTPDRLKNIHFAIAFDRKGTNEIITHQYEGRTASDGFAEDLATLLQPLRYTPSDGGTFTDTANYARLIPECTNISVGYYRQHERHEHLDMAHAAALRAILTTADFTALKPRRTPEAPSWPVYTPVGGRTWAKQTPTAKSWWSTYQEQQQESFDAYVRREHANVAAFLETKGVTKDEIEAFIWRGWKQ